MAYDDDFEKKTLADAKRLNEAIFDALSPPSQRTPKTQDEVDEAAIDALSRIGNPDLERAARDAVNNYTRQGMREESFMRRIMPPIPIKDDELDRSVPSSEYAARKLGFDTYMGVDNDGRPVLCRVSDTERSEGSDSHS